MAFSDFMDLNDPCMAKANASKDGLKSSSGLVPTSSSWHLQVLKLPFNTGLDEIETLFVKYGTISKVALIYECDNKSMNCYLSYEKEMDSIDALKENGKKVGASSITVGKYTKYETEKGNKRMRTEDSTADSAWGSTPAVSNSDAWGSSDTATTDAWGSSNTAPTDSWGTASTSFGSSDSRGRGRGRGGGGRGGGSGGRACFNCGEEGHMSRECPKPKANGGSRACFKCGEEGHISRDCPKGGGRACFNCGEEGHMSRECSKPRGSNPSRGRGGRGGGNGGNSSFNTSSTDWGTTETTTTTSASDSAWD